MQLRDMDRRPQAAAREVSVPPPTDGRCAEIVPETRCQTGDGEAGLYDLEGGVWVPWVPDGWEADQPPDHPLDSASESDLDSRHTLPPPYSSNPSLGEHVV